MTRPHVIADAATTTFRAAIIGGSLGGLAAASIIGLGVNPYINSSIIMQLMRGVIPALEELP